MALQSNLTKENNDYKIDFNSVYFKIDDCFIDTLEEEVRVGLRGYADEYARQHGGMGIFKKVYEIKFSDLVITSFSRNDILASCYNYLKTLDEFKTSLSV